MQKFLIIIDGPMGSGKTTIGKLVHTQLPRTAILSTDAIKFFISDFERGERDNAISAAVLMQMCKEYIKHDINILLPQAFWRIEYIEPYMKLAEENGLQFFAYQLEGSRKLLLERIHNRPTPAAAKTPVPEERILNNLKTWENNRYGLGKIFNVDTLNSEQIASLILADVLKK